MHEMSTYFLQKNYTAQLNDIVAVLLAYHHFPEAEKLHRIRVAIKKIKSIFNFEKFVHQHKNQDRTINELFKKTGALRELNMHMQLTRGITKNNEPFIYPMLHQIDVLEKLFLKAVPKFISHIHCMRKQTKSRCFDVKIKSLKAYFNTYRKIAMKHIKKHKKRDLHALRKTIKKIMYVYAFLPIAIQQQISLDYEKWSAVQSALGDWHDSYVARRYLTKSSFLHSSKQFFSVLKLHEKMAYKKLIQKLSAIENI